MSDARNAVASATSALFDMGVRAERERIIALLGDDAEIWHSENLQADLIALIKGENE